MISIGILNGSDTTYCRTADSTVSEIENIHHL